MKIAIVGSSGYIAEFLIKKFSSMQYIQKVLKIDKTNDADAYLDLKEAQSFDYSVLEDIDYVLMTAAISSPDECATRFNLCWAINVVGTEIFIREAIKQKCRVLFFSSDAVFGDIPGAIYDEKSETCAATAYGKMKKAIEDTFKNEKYFKAIRLSYVVSLKDKFVSYCLDCMQKGILANIFHPFYRNCIIVNDVVDVVVWFIEHWEEYSPFVLNVAGKELVSRVRIADEINRHLKNGLDFKIETPDFGFYRNRPAITQMKSLYLEQYQILQSSTFTEKIKYILEDYKNE